MDEKSDPLMTALLTAAVTLSILWVISVGVIIYWAPSYS